MSERARIAVLGLGRMGSAIARRLEHAGHELSVWNRTAGRDDAFTRRGARRLDRPQQALAVADVCLLALSDSAAVEEVATGPDGVL